MGRSPYTLHTAAVAVVVALVTPGVHAQDSLCAQVKIEIKQELTLERQAFDAEMRIANGLDTAALENVAINVSFADEVGTAVRASSDPNDATALFFIRVDTLSGIDRIDGTGRVAPATTAQINWLIIPSPGAGGTTPIGKLYLVGATLTYTLAGEVQTLQVTPDSIYIKPLPKLALDYFLTREVYADDPFTAAVEPPEPFTLGVRIKNTGAATARNVKIDSAQPRIVENKQGLLINFVITGSYVNDQPASNSLLIDFGSIAPARASTGRWSMLTTLSGRFVDFSATFTHADELGGALTSLLERTDAHLLVKDVRVDLPGRDGVRDFLAKDGDVLRVYESDTEDTAVTDQSASASLGAGTTSGNAVAIGLNAPPTAGFFYVKLPDPYRGSKAVGTVTRSDGKILPAENVWFSKTLLASGQWDYFINFFDAASTGRYNLLLAEANSGPRPPALQFIPNRTVKEGEQVSFIVEASDPNGDAVQFSAAPLPAGARFVEQSSGVAVFDWTPALGQAGGYPIAFTASDGSLVTTQVATITVEGAPRAAGPDIPTLVAPALDAETRVLRPILLVTSGNPLDTATKYQLEVYGDAGLTELLAQGEADRKPDATQWKVPLDLMDDTRYWWRVRAFDGTVYSEWITGRFLVNLANDAPSLPQVDTPRDGTQVDSATPVLAARNSSDPESDPVRMAFEVFADRAATQPLVASGPLPPGPNGVTRWMVPTALAEGIHYLRITATDQHGAISESPLTRFTVNPANHAPAAPTVAQPALGAVLPGTSATLEVSATDADGDALSYVFEIDQVESFNSPSRRRYEGGTFWNVADLTDNVRYFWRARAYDGKAEGAWATGSFLVSAVNEPPAAPVLANLGAGSWTDALRPRLEVAPARDPEGGPVSYEFQVSTDPGFGSLIAQGQSAQSAWLVPTGLVTGTTYHWRARAIDAETNASPWSAAASFLADARVVSAPTIAFSAPTKLVLVDSASVTVAWDSRDPENNAKLSLYYDRDNAGADGQEIVKDLPLDPAKRAGTYTWDVSGLAPGPYYIYGVIDNGARTTAAYAPGVFVVPAAQPQGSVVVKPTSARTTTEAGAENTLQISLGSAPTTEVVIDLTTTRSDEAALTPQSLTFTPENWGTPQTVTVRGLNDCSVDGDVPYRVVPNRAVSTDVAYAGVSGGSLDYVNLDNDAPGNSTFTVCDLALISSRRVGVTEYEYVMTARVGNSGPAVSAVSMVVSSTSKATKIIDNEAIFSPVPAGQTVSTSDTFTFRHDRRFPLNWSNFTWNLIPSP